MNLIHVMAFDLGASSGRAMLGSFDGQKIELNEIHRFTNMPVFINGHLHWDVLKLFDEMKIGLRKVKNMDIEIDSICVDTWGVDFGYFDHHGDLLYSPFHYRDQRTNDIENELYNLISQEELFFETGVQPANLNTINQIYADINRKPYLKQFVSNVMFMPDIFSYLFSGQITNEFTIASTSCLLNKDLRTWSVKLFNKLGIPISWFSSITQSGTVIKEVHPKVQEELEINKQFKVIAGTSHDTASAVLAVPYENKDDSVFISCGTWSLIGIETDKPIVTKEVFQSGLTNEGCLNGKNRLLKNSTGLWILQELQRYWSQHGNTLSFEEMTNLAEKIEDNRIFIDVNDPIFTSPGNMEKRIVELCKKTGQSVPNSKGQFIKAVIDSLALSYKNSIDNIEKVTGAQIKVIHMVGGGIKNKLLCQSTANITGRKVIAGPMEASSLGNILSQLIALSTIQQEETTEIIKNSFSPIEYIPNKSNERISKLN